MSDSTAEFLEALGRRGYEPLLAKVRGRVRIDMTDGGEVDRWLVTIDNGVVDVSDGDGDADCTIRGARALLDAICRGDKNAMAAVLRNELVCTGDVELLFAIQRTFPGPPQQRPRPTAAKQQP
jgi:predicted lipid carrier protein YhbT